MFSSSTHTTITQERTSETHSGVAALANEEIITAANESSTPDQLTAPQLPVLPCQECVRFREIDVNPPTGNVPWESYYACSISRCSNGWGGGIRREVKNAMQQKKEGRGDLVVLFFSGCFVLVHVCLTPDSWS